MTEQADSNPAAERRDRRRPRQTSALAVIGATLVVFGASFGYLTSRLEAGRDAALRAKPTLVSRQVLLRRFIVRRVIDEVPAPVAVPIVSAPPAVYAPPPHFAAPIVTRSS